MQFIEIPLIQSLYLNYNSFIHNNPDEFPEWHNSDSAKLFSPPKIVNKKENKGYWF